MRILRINPMTPWQNKMITFLFITISLKLVETVSQVTVSANGLVASDNNMLHEQRWPRSMTIYGPGHDDLTHWVRDKMADISQTTFLNAFSVTLKWLGHFFKMWFHFLMLFTLCATFFYMQLVQYNECLIGIVNTGGLVLQHQGISSHSADDAPMVSRCLRVNGNMWLSINKGPNNNILSLVQIIACRRSGDKPLSEPIMENLLTHICVTRPR